jgi:hypothetical protein
MVKNVSYTLVYTICISMPICMRVCMYLCGARACVCACMCVYTRAYIPHIHMRYTPTQKKKPGRIQSQDDGSPTRTRYDVRTSVPPRSKPPPPNPQTHTHTHMPNLQKQATILTNPSPQNLHPQQRSPRPRKTGNFPQQNHRHGFVEISSLGKFSGFRGRGEHGQRCCLALKTLVCC